MLLCQLQRDSLQRAFGLRARYARFEPANGEQVVVATLIEPGTARLDHFAHHCGDEYFRRISDLCTDEAFGHDADDCEGASIERYTLADDVQVCAEASLPAAVTQDCDRVRARRLVLFRQEATAKHRRHAEHIEIISRNNVAPDALVRPAVAQA